jgi:aryl-alcohol dehydrogenase-like predicted oxidoreductase
LVQVATARGAPLAAVALAWLLQKPGVTAPIIGASQPLHFDDALAALDITLTGDEVAALQAPYLPHAVVGFS